MTLHFAAREADPETVLHRRRRLPSPSPSTQVDAAARLDPTPTAPGHHEPFSNADLLAEVQAAFRSVEAWPAWLRGDGASEEAPQTPAGPGVAPASSAPPASSTSDAKRPFTNRELRREVEAAAREVAAWPSWLRGSGG